MLLASAFIIFGLEVSGEWANYRESTSCHFSLSVVQVSKVIVIDDGAVPSKFVTVALIRSNEHWLEKGMQAMVSFTLF